MTDTDEETELRRASDHQIACRLMQQQYITARQHEVWCRSRAGETLYRIRRDYPNQARGGGLFAASTLYRWVEEVDAAIRQARTVTTDPEQPPLPNPFGVSVADGHLVRLAADGTPQGRVSTEQSTWDVEGMKAAGKVDRYSRKRG